MAYAIRSFCSSDAPFLADLTVAAIRRIGIRAYSNAQVEAWAARHPGPERFVSSAQGGATILVAADEADNAIAYALLEKAECMSGHIDMLYCHPDHSKRGLAEQLLQKIEQSARALGMTRLFTEASELARAAFERAEFQVKHRRDFEIDGVPIHNYMMEKHLG